MTTSASARRPFGGVAFGITFISVGTLVLGLRRSWCPGSASTKTAKATPRLLTECEVFHLRIVNASL
jgi:hypothetical protein